VKTSFWYYVTCIGLKIPYRVFQNEPCCGAGSEVKV